VGMAGERPDTRWRRKLGRTALVPMDGGVPVGLRPRGPAVRLLLGVAELLETAICSVGTPPQRIEVAIGGAWLRHAWHRSGARLGRGRRRKGSRDTRLGGGLYRARNARSPWRTRQENRWRRYPVLTAMASDQMGLAGLATGPAGAGQSKSGLRARPKRTG
jgi:hypothetical protein